MRAAWLVPLLIVACSVDLEPLVAGGDAGSAAKGGSAKDASVDQCSWNCGNGGSGASGGWTGDASGGVGAQAGFNAGGSGAVAGGANGGNSGVGATGGSGGTTPVFQCYPISQIPAGCSDANQQACSCLGCNYVYCEDPEDQYPLNDCVCYECWGSPSCPPQACNGDGLCDPYAEGCGCGDCKFHPECYGY